MRIADVTKLLAVNIVRHTGLFSEILPNVQSVTVSGSNATVTTSRPHGLGAYSYIFTPSRRISNTITAIAPIQDGYKIRTQFAHDLSGDYSDVMLRGFGNAWDGDYKVSKSIAFNEFTIRASGKPAHTLTGQEQVLSVAELGLYPSGLTPVTIISPTSFSFALGGDYTGREFVFGNICYAVRVAAAANLDNAAAQYTKQKPEKLWAFCVPGDAILNKSRRANGDAQSEEGAMTAAQEDLIDNFSVYVFAPARDDYAAVEAIDICRHDLLAPMLKSLRGIKFQTGTSSGAVHTASFTGHSLDGISTDAFLVYRYDFQMMTRLTSEDRNRNAETVSINTLTLDIKLENGVPIGRKSIQVNEGN